MKHDIALLKQLLFKLEVFKRDNNWLDDISGYIVIDKYRLVISLEGSDVIEKVDVLKAILYLQDNKCYYFFIEEDASYTNITCFEQNQLRVIYNNGEWLC